MRSPLRRLSFHAKLLLSFVIIVVIASVVGYLFINQSVKRAFSDFAVRSFTLQDQILVQLIVGYYNRTGTFEGVIDLLKRSPREVPLFLADPEGRVAFAPVERHIGQHLSDEQLEEGQSIILPDGETWTVVPYRHTPGRGVLEEGFLRTTRRSLWLAALAAGAVGLLLALLLLRQVTGPLKRLDAAAQRIAEGNLSERVDIESSDEIGHLAASFNEMAASIEASEQAKKRMIADVSHELRAPLTTVRSALEGLRDGLVEPSEETFTALHSRILLFTRLVNDLHQLALVDAGRLSIRRSSTSLRSILDGIVEAVGVELEDASISLVCDVDDDLPNLDIDAHRVEQVFLNLLANALRHTPEGGTIAITAHSVDTSWIEVSVCDSGPGLAPSELAHIFDRFYRTDEARTGAGGAGLGLSIAKALTEAHGGRITAENGDLGGACFRFSLPTDRSGAA